MTIELIEGTLDTASVSRIVSEVLRWMTFDPDAIEHVRATTPTWRDWIGVLDGEPVGVGGCGVSPGMEESSAVSGALCVVPAARHRGVGGTLYRRISEHARELGREQLELFSFSDDPDCDGFAARHGFTVVMRARGLRLQLEGCPRPEVTPPAGVTITTLAERPDLGHGVWETAGEALPDIPYDSDVPPQPGTYEQFAAQQLAGPRHIPEATFVALARRTGRRLRAARLDRPLGGDRRPRNARRPPSVARPWDRPVTQGRSDRLGARQRAQRASHRQRGTKHRSPCRQRPLPLHADARRTRVPRPLRSRRVTPAYGVTTGRR